MKKEDRQWMINQAYNDLVKEIRRDLKEEILDDIVKRTNQMEKVLANGRPLFESAIGYSRIYDARTKVWNKIKMLLQMWSLINDHY